MALDRALNEGDNDTLGRGVKPKIAQSTLVLCPSPPALSIHRHFRTSLTNTNEALADEANSSASRGPKQAISTYSNAKAPTVQSTRG